MAGDPRAALETAGIRTGPDCAAPATAFTAVRTATGVDLDGELRTMYEAWNGGSVGEVNVYDLADVAEVNPDLREAIPFGLFFGDDGRDGAFFVDLDGSLGQAGAIYWTNRGRLVPADSIPVGDSLSDFLESAGRGRAPVERYVDPRIEGLTISARRSNGIATAGSRTGFCPRREVMDGLRAAKSMPREMHNLQRAVGSPRFPGVGVAILPMDGMTPVEGAIDAEGDPARAVVCKGPGCHPSTRSRRSAGAIPTVAASCAWPRARTRQRRRSSDRCRGW